jgi:iron complex transport system substrate-binding protein
MKLYYLLISCLLCFSCKNEVKEISPLPSSTSKELKLKYADGFTVIDNGNYKTISIKTPWPNAEKEFKYAIISKENAAKTTFLKNEFDGIILTPIEKIIVTSTTHIPALELLNVEEKLIGFPGRDYISSEKTRARIENDLVKEVGKNESLNTELILSLQPNLIVAFGVDGTSKSLNTIKNANIPIIYNGDWVEKSPLAKAEWIKFFGVLFNQQKKADSIFNNIERDYLDAKKLANNITSRPSVLSGAMHKDVWYLPSGTSTEAQILKDANVNYLWHATESKGSLALNFETVFTKAQNADIWISPSYYPSYKALSESNSHYANFDAFKNKNIYTFSNTTGATGGVTYYELGTARPDLVLKDIIKICHPEVLTDYNTTFFKPLK